MYYRLEPQEFTKGSYDNNCTKVAGTSKGNRIVSIAQKRDYLERQFMDIAFKANRAESQRESRRAKR